MLWHTQRNISCDLQLSYNFWSVTWHSVYFSHKKASKVKIIKNKLEKTTHAVQHTNDICLNQHRLHPHIQETPKSSQTHFPHPRRQDWKPENTSLKGRTWANLHPCVHYKTFFPPEITKNWGFMRGTPGSISQRQNYNYLFISTRLLPSHYSWAMEGTKRNYQYSRRDHKRTDVGFMTRNAGMGCPEAEGHQGHHLPPADHLVVVCCCEFVNK